MKYFVFRGKNNPGSIQCKYCFFDLIDIDASRDIKTQTRKHAYRVFYEMGASAKTMRTLVSSFRKNIPFRRNNKEFTKNALVWEHTNTFLIYVPLSDFTKFEKM